MTITVDWVLRVGFLVLGLGFSMIFGFFVFKMKIIFDFEFWFPFWFE
jgi:hypothetical protein